MDQLNATELEKELFPGCSFDTQPSDEDTGSADQFRAERFLDMINNLAPAAKKEFKKQIISKHRQYGAVSMFKGVEETLSAKARYRAKNEIVEIQEASAHEEQEISSIEQEISSYRVYIYY